MAFENLGKVLSTPKYLGILVVSAAILMWLYIGPLTNQANYNAFGWIFAMAFPILAGGIIAGQWYNLAESKTCPASATVGGIIGTLAGIVTVACPICPLVLLGWIGLAAGTGGALFGGPWLKAISLILMVLALYWSTSKR